MLWAESLRCMVEAWIRFRLGDDRSQVQGIIAAGIIEQIGDLELRL